MNARVGGDLVIETCHSSTVDFGQYFHSKELYTYVVVTKGSDGGHFDDACEQCVSALLQVWQKLDSVLILKFVKKIRIILKF